MNKILGTIKKVTVSPYMALVVVESRGDLFAAALQETPAGVSRYKEGLEVTLLFKETDVALAQGLAGKISIRNRAEATVRSLETAGVLTRVILDYKGSSICSVITSVSAEYLDLKPGDAVEWLVKASEMSISGA